MPAPVVAILPSSIRKWNVADVSNWLTTELELPLYVTVFREQAIDGTMLLTLDHDSLKLDPPDGCGVKVC